MNKELEVWQFISSRLKNSESAMLLVVAESSGSSPGRAGYKMAVTANGELCGSIGGGVMEVSLVEQAKASLSLPTAGTGEAITQAVEQVHQKNAPNASGMICSGKQTVVFKQLTAADLPAVWSAVDGLVDGSPNELLITKNEFTIGPPIRRIQDTSFTELSETDFIYTERLGPTNELIIIGGGHCALALSEIASKLDFRIRIFDDRPELNTLEKNEFADEITIIGSYENVGEHIATGERTYVVVMTLGYASDAVVIRQLIDREFKYFGVLGSKAKMATLMKELRAQGFDEVRLSRIHTPIGLPINSRTPEEIAVSIAAEIIAVKNAD